VQAKIALGILAAALAISAVTDLRERRILNAVTYPALLAVSACILWLGGPVLLVEALLGALVCTLPFLLAAWRGWMGAGDVKLMAAVGIFLGWPDSFLAVALTTGAGAVAALGLLAAKGGLTNYLRRYGAMAKCLLFTGRVAYVPPEPEESSTLLFPYALAIALGTFATLAWAGRLDTFLEILIGGVHV
jgi:prepilin peptidase CpaA